MTDNPGDAAAPPAQALEDWHAAYIDDCVRLLGEDHELTDASRKLLSFIDSQSRGGLSLFWDGSTLV
jgi:hypothetical protein